MSQVSASLEGPSHTGGFRHTIVGPPQGAALYAQHEKSPAGSVQLRKIAQAHSVRQKNSRLRHQGKNAPSQKHGQPEDTSMQEPASETTKSSADGRSVFVALRESPPDPAAFTAGSKDARLSSKLPLALPARPKHLGDFESAAHDTEGKKPSSSRSAGAIEDQWTGDKVENELSEQVVRDGYTSKSKVQNEMGTARSSLWPHLKSASSLTSLSSAFVFALQQRQERDNVTSASTFKPPPRVTLTDARKTAWLSELADESVPLRRLSRTIPHGVRGRVLLEQCLQNQIPPSRAMWLVKCVGANELRAFRRKGVSDATVADNETRWVAEWTVHIERFLAEPLRDTDLSCLDFQYAVRLTARIFEEGLLDREHFLTWLHSNIETASIDDLPYILIQLRCWLDELTCSFKHAYRTRNASARRLRDLRLVGHHNLYTPVIDSLERLLRSFKAACPLSFLDFSTDEDQSMSQKLYDGLRPMCVGIEHVTKATWQVLSDLSARKVVPEAPGRFAIDLEHQARIDPASLDGFLSLTLSSPNYSLTDVITGVMEWAASKYRPNGGRLLAGARLLRTLSQTTADANAVIVKVVGDIASSRCISELKMGRLVAEAARLKCFDVGQYLRWLVSTGALDGDETTAKVHSCILRDMPRDGLPAGLSSLLGQIRTRQGVAWDQAKLFHSLKTRANERMATARKHRRSDVLAMSKMRTVFPWPVKMQVADELLSSVRTALDNKASFDEECMEECMDVLEDLGDETKLAEALELLVPLADVSILPSMSETVTRHRSELSALGKLEVLRIMLVRQYHSTRRVDSPDRSVLDSLLALATADPRNPRIEKHVQHEIELFEQRPGIAAQTPMSEGLGNETENVSLDPFHASFKSLQTIEAICIALADNWGMCRNDGTQLRLLTLATKAALDRVFDGSVERFIVSVTSHLVTLYESGKAHLARRVWRFFLASGLLSLKALVPQSNRMCRAPSDSPGAYLFAVDLLDLVSTRGDGIRPNNVPTTYDMPLIAPNASTGSPLFSLKDAASDVPLRRFARRRFALQVSLFAEHSSAALVSLLLQLVRKVDRLPEEDQLRLQDLCGCEFVASLIVDALFRDDSSVLLELGQAITPTMSTDSRPCLERLLSRMMDPGQEADLPSKPFTGIVRFAIETTNDCSAPIHRFCLPRLGLMRAGEQRDAETARGHVLKAVYHAVSHGKLLWSTLLPVLPPDLDVSATIRTQAEAALFARHDASAAAAPSPLNEAPSALLLDIVRATASTIADTPDEPSTPARVLASLEALASAGPHAARLTDMLHLALLHHGAFAASAPRRTRLLAALAPLLAAPSALPRDAHTLAAATLAFFALDAPAPETRALLAALPPRAQADATLRFLLSAPPARAADAAPQLFLQTQAPPPPVPPALPSGAPFALAGAGAGPTSILAAGRGVARAPFVRSAWELVPDAGGGEEGTAVGLRLFGARKVES